MSNSSVNRKLSAKEIAKYEKMFKMFEKRNKGSFGVKELTEVIQSYGMTISEQEIRELISEMDTNDTESVTFDEFLKLSLKKTKDSEAEEELREAFKVFDRDGNGFISTDDLKHAINGIDDPLTNEEFDEMVNEIDVNDNQEINYEELITLMTSAHQ
jgi:calmodulin